MMNQAVHDHSGWLRGQPATFNTIAELAPNFPRHTNPSRHRPQPHTLHQQCLGTKQHYLFLVGKKNRHSRKQAGPATAR